MLDILNISKKQYMYFLVYLEHIHNFIDSSLLECPRDHPPIINNIIHNPLILGQMAADQ